MFLIHGWVVCLFIVQNKHIFLLWPVRYVVQTQAKPGGLREKTSFSLNSVQFWGRIPLLYSIFCPLDRLYWNNSKGKLIIFNYNCILYLHFIFKIGRYMFLLWIYWINILLGGTFHLSQQENGQGAAVMSDNNYSSESLLQSNWGKIQRLFCFTLF